MQTEPTKEKAKEKANPFTALLTKNFIEKKGEENENAFNLLCQGAEAVSSLLLFSLFPLLFY
jgi:hypothetical protein